MVYTVTFNPAIDYVVRMDEYKIGMTNRTDAENMYFGGKGINVSLVLRELGVASKALGFVAGFTGQAIEEGVAKKGVTTDFVHLANGNSRINVKIKSDEETEINGQGPDITAGALDELYEKLDKLEDGDVLVLAGSIPKSMPSDVYEKILERLSKKEIMSVVDATGKLLLNVLKYKPFLIKPNNYELAEIFNVSIESTSDIEKYAKKLQEMGAINVLVSWGAEGALLVDERGEVHTMPALGGKPVNTVGAGDSMVAGFIAGMLKNSEINYEYALKLGSAAGGATAISEDLATAEEINRIFGEID